MESDSSPVPVVLMTQHPGASPRTRGRDEASEGPGAGAEAAVTRLYGAHALALTRLAHVMLGDRTAAEDVVQDAFWGLYQRWGTLADAGKALAYLRSSVLNGCRSELRRRRRRGLFRDDDADESWPGDGPARASVAMSAESSVLNRERSDEILAAVTALPRRQREVLVLRYYLDEPEAVIAELLGISGSTVRSTAHRALAALGTRLREKP